MKFLFICEPLSYEWLGIMYISSALKQSGVQTRLFVAGGDINEITAWKPDFVGYSVMTGSHRKLLELNASLKKKIDFISVFGGPHPTYFPEMANEAGVDYIIRGEGEESVKRLLEKPKEKIIFSPLPEDLDKIPFPDRGLLYSQSPKNRDNPIKHFIASRGCPFDCPYCYNHVNASLYPGQKRVRYRTPENVIAEIRETVKTYPTKFIYFQDDCFDLNKNWLYPFLELYKQKINMPFHCIVRLDLLDETTAKNLKNSGCICVRCALESGNDRLRNTLLKRKMSKTQVIEGTRILRKYDIKFVLQNMLGLPTGTLETDLETLRLNISSKPTLAWASIFQPYPGTELGALYPRLTIDNIGSNFYDDSPIDLPEKDKIRRLQKLFGFIAEHPYFYAALPLLLRLPLDIFYKKIWLSNNTRADKELYGGII